MIINDHQTSHFSHNTNLQGKVGGIKMNSLANVLIITQLLFNGRLSLSARYIILWLEFARITIDNNR